MEDSKHKFILFTLEFPPQKGGVSKYYENLVKHWPDGDLLVLTDGLPEKKDGPNVIRRQLTKKYLRPRWLPAFFHLRQILKRANGHVIIGQILPLGLAAYLLSKVAKFEYSIVLHGLDFSLAMNRTRISKKILTGAKRIICANGYTASLVRSFDSSLTDKIAVVNPGLDPNFVRNPAKVKELKERYGLTDKKVLFGLGRLVKRKGFDKVIAAMEIITRAENDVVLVIGGSGPEEQELKKLANGLPRDIAKKIIFTGKIYDDDYWAWLELCDIFIMTSRDIAGDYEGFGIVYLEANLAAKPVIAGDSGGVRDAVLDNVNGILVNPESVESIAEAAIDLLGSERLRQELGAHGNRRVVETMSAKKQAEKFHKYLIN